jgi:hypothetical protein
MDQLDDSPSSPTTTPFFPSRNRSCTFRNIVGPAFGWKVPSVYGQERLGWEVVM